MLDLIIAQDAGVSEVDSVISAMNSEGFTAAVILGIIGTVAVAITFIGCVTTTIQNIVATRMAFKMINELAARGYSAEEVERLVYGDKNFSRKVKQMFARAKGRIGNQLGSDFRESTNGRPAPPVKQAS
jgi:hypothetical protein